MTTGVGDGDRDPTPLDRRVPALFVAGVLLLAVATSAIFAGHPDVGLGLLILGVLLFGLVIWRIRG